MGRSVVSTSLRTICIVDPEVVLMTDLSEEEFQALYAWVDEIPLSRQKKNVARDFSDGVMAAEVVHYFLPKLVELHNYSPANSQSQKLDNWRTLNMLPTHCDEKCRSEHQALFLLFGEGLGTRLGKVFSRLNFNLPDDIIQGVVASKPGVIEFILTNLRNKIERYFQNRTMRENARQEQGYPTREEVYRGVVYNPDQLPTNYRAGESLAYNHQELARHPTPAHLPGGQFPHLAAGGGYPNPSFHTADGVGRTMTPVHAHTKPSPFLHVHSHPPHTTHVSKIPAPNHRLVQLKKDYTMDTERHFSIPSLPPLNPGQQLTMSEPRCSNPEKRSKLPSLDGWKHNYAQNPNRRLPINPKAAVLPHGHTKQREGSAGLTIRIAEKDQRILESQEYIQLLQMKVTRLEHLVQIKDMRIAELSRHLEMTRHPLQKR